MTLNLPDYVGSCAFGIKMGVIVPGSDLQTMLLQEITKLDRDNMLADCDVLAITESIVARAQNNFIGTDVVAEDVRETLSLQPDSTVGVVFPIASRNRFSLIMEGIARAVPEGQVAVQFSYPHDEVGNQIIPPEVACELEARTGGLITSGDLDREYTHPLTGVNYIGLYEEIIRRAGAAPRIFLCNDPRRIDDFEPDGVVVADIHTRERTRSVVSGVVGNCYTLRDLCNRGDSPPTSEWGLLGSNMSSGSRLKLAPYLADVFACSLQEEIREATGKHVEILIYGDGAYKDPGSGIYELADPITAFGATAGIDGCLREGFKMKYLVDLHHEAGRSEEEISALLREESARTRAIDCITCEGTTPRCMRDVLASLADLVSGSADAGTPMILIKGIYNRESLEEFQGESCPESLL
ncbi:hypothetical protein ASZ90_010441 [hydrocarbon metagenome]|uniref:Coenzyme F420:L-glutamate ligase-like domain-containing protein n=1 Tax=hydrocarbon metagenome TaxID=938273 RepID=A0A0W8FG41_9ZZZZ